MRRHDSQFYILLLLWEDQACTILNTKHILVHLIILTTGESKFTQKFKKSKHSFSTEKKTQTCTYLHVYNTSVQILYACRNVLQYRCNILDYVFLYVKTHSKYLSIGVMPPDLNEALQQHTLTPIQSQLDPRHPVKPGLERQPQ